MEHYEKVRGEVKLASGDYVDLKMYEPAMRHLIDTYIRAEESRKVSSFDDLSLVQLIVERGVDAVGALPEGIRKDQHAVAEVIENNVRRLIIDEQPINPRYYEKMSQLLDALIRQRREAALDYQKYLERIVELTRRIKDPAAEGSYPTALTTPGRRALYDNLDREEPLALAVDEAVRASRQDDWRSNAFKVKRAKNAIRGALEGQAARSPEGATPADRTRETRSWGGEAGESSEGKVERILELVKNQDEY